MVKTKLQGCVASLVALNTVWEVGKATYLPELVGYAATDLSLLEKVSRCQESLLGYPLKIVKVEDTHEKSSCLWQLLTNTSSVSFSYRTRHVNVLSFRRLNKQ